MKIYPPHKIFLNFLLVYICIAFLFLILPGEKYEISNLIPGYSSGDDSKVSRISRPPEMSGLVIHPAEEEPDGKDSTLIEESILFPEFIREVPIEYPAGNNEIFLPFINSIDSSKSELSQTRILHYGDSQLEGDRISKYLRARLQNEFGKASIILDNISQRGSAGLEFSEDSAHALREMTASMKPDLIILQYGINVVPAKTNDFTYYGTYLKRELEVIKDVVPDVPILVIGVSDMGHMLDGNAVAYSTVEKVSKVQRKAAMESGAAFFNLLEFMGGSGSFIRWAEEDPPLIRRDYTHFSISGGAIVAEGIAQALIWEIEKYQNKNEN